MHALLKFTQFVSKTFALWVLLFALLAFLSPETFYGSANIFLTCSVLSCSAWGLR